jgi:hypothetical protein
LTIVDDPEVQGDLDDWFPLQPVYESEPAEQAEIAMAAETSAPAAAEQARALAAAPVVVSEATKIAVARVAAALALATQNVASAEMQEAASYIAELAQTASTVAKPPPKSPPKPWFWPANPTTIERLVLPLRRATYDADKNQCEQHVELFAWYRRAEEVLLGFLERKPKPPPEGRLSNWELFRRLLSAAIQPFKYDSQRLHQLDNAVALTHIFVLHERTNEWTERIVIDEENWPVPTTPWDAPQCMETDPSEPIRLPMLGTCFFVGRCTRARMEYKVFDHPAREVLEKKLGKAGADLWQPKPWREWYVTKRTLAYSIDHLKKFRKDLGFRYCVQRHRSEKFRANWHQLVSNLEGYLPLIATFHQASAIDALRAVDCQSRALLDRLVNPDRTRPPPGPFIPHIRPDEPIETVEERERRINQDRFRHEQKSIAKTKSDKG